MRERELWRDYGGAGGTPPGAPPPPPPPTDLYELGVVRGGVAWRQLVEHLGHDPEVPLHQSHLATQLLLLENGGESIHRLTGDQVNRLTGDQVNRLTGDQVNRLTDRDSKGPMELEDSFYL